MHKGDCNTENEWRRQNSITYCVINYNGEKYLEATLKSIFDQAQHDDEVILIDNCSTDRSLQVVNHQFRDVKVIQMNDNLGPGAARNAGFESAVNDWILFIDNDVSLNRCCVDILVAALKKHPAAVAAMPRVLFANNSDIIQYDGADAHYLGLMRLHNQKALANKVVNETKIISSIVSACLLLKRTDWESSELFDEYFFIYFDDHDFGMRAQMLGHELISVPTATVLHREGTPGLSLREKGRYTKIRIYNLIRNRWLLIIKYYQIRTLAILLPMIMFYEFVQLATVIKRGWHVEWMMSVNWMVKNIKGILAKRRMVQRSRIKEDREILIGGRLPFSSYLAKSNFDRFGIKFIDMAASIYWDAIKRIL